MLLRHALGVLGVCAAGVLLAVSAAMNYRFGFNLGRTEADGFIYGAASAAADCFKALIPFFFFAAIRSKVWSQAVAAAIVGVVVSAYSLTSALGHAALNRAESTGTRAVEASIYQDLRADLKRAQDQLSWVPQHRPAQTVEADIANAKNQRPWIWTENCAKVTGKQGREFCGQYNALVAEKAAAEQASQLETRISSIQTRLAQSKGGQIGSSADPQAAVLAQLAQTVMPDVKVEDVQMAMTIFIALLLEVGSTFGMYVAFAQWRLHDVKAPPAPRMVAEASTAAAAVATKTVAEPVVVETAPLPAVATKKPRSSANDNKTVATPAPKRLVPESDVERYYRESVDVQDGSTVSATGLYEDYCRWCEDRQKEPLALPTFCRDFSDLGVQRIKRRDGVRYIGIALKSDQDLEEDKNLPALGTQAA